MFPDEATTSLCAWNARNASRQQLLSLGNIQIEGGSIIFRLKLEINVVYIYRT